MGSAEWSYSMKNDSLTLTPGAGQSEFVKFEEPCSEEARLFGKGLDDALEKISRREDHESSLVVQDSVTCVNIPDIDSKNPIILQPLSSTPSDLQNIFDSNGKEIGIINASYDLTAMACNPQTDQTYSTINTETSGSILSCPLASDGVSELVGGNQETEANGRRPVTYDTDDKRLRNRQAAQNSRLKKQQKSQQLNEQVKKLKKLNDELEKQYQELDKTVSQIKKEIYKHKKNGCQIEAFST